MIRLLGFSALALNVTLVGACQHTAPNSPIAVRFERRGDDGLTLKLADAVLRHLEYDPSFQLAAPNSSACVVRIVNHVSPRSVDGLRGLAYEVGLFRADDQPIQAIRGECNETEIDQCGQSIVAKALPLLQPCRAAS